MVDWDAIADTITGFLGWAEPEDTDPRQARYAIIEKREPPRTWIYWERVCVLDSGGVSRLRGNYEWIRDHYNGIELAVKNAEDHRKMSNKVCEFLRR